MKIFILEKIKYNCSKLAELEAPNSDEVMKASTKINHYDQVGYKTIKQRVDVEMGREIVIYKNKMLKL